MTEPNPTPPAEPAAPPAEPAAPPAPPADPPKNDPPRAAEAYDSRALMESVNALPERIVNAIRELSAPPASPPKNAPTAPAASTPAEPAREPGKKTYKSFGHRWFGIDS